MTAACTKAACPASDGAADRNATSSRANLSCALSERSSTSVRACNVDGNWDDACSQIGGVWSEEECFCFVGAAPRPTINANNYVADDEEFVEAERVCWWSWRETCEPDTWVDAGYEWVCNGPSSDDCGYEHDDNGGYWESGDCSGYWLRRCDDGSQKRYG